MWSKHNAVNTNIFIGVGVGIGTDWLLDRRAQGVIALKRNLSLSLACLVAIMTLLNGSPLLAQEPKRLSIRQQLPRSWYMGTMMGFDCDLKINANGTLTVQYGGCFHRDPVITSRWTGQGDKIKLQNPALHQSLGTYLQVVRYKGYLVLLPARPQQVRGKHKYSYYHCFWRNMMKNGLKLPKDAPE